MAIVQISKIQVRTGAESDLPQLDIGELGFATDTKNAYIGNDPLLDPPVGIQPTLTKLLTDSPNCHINASQLTGIINVDTGNIKITGGRNGYVLKTDGSGNLSWGVSAGGGGGTGIANSLNTQLLFNSGDYIYGDSNLVYDNTTHTLTLIGNIIATSLTGTLTVASNAQPNITSVGTLISLDVGGNITSGNANLGNLVISNYFSGSGNLLSNVTAVKSGTVTTNAQPNITSVGTLTGLTVTGVTTLGNVGNVKISNGSAGQVLTTDGYGNLSWATVSGGGGGSVYGDANVTTLLNGGFFNTTFVGTIPNSVHANYAEMANGVAGANVTGQVSNALVAGTVYTAAQPNITSVGTLLNLTVTGNIGVGNITVGNITASYLSGNGSKLSSITASNIVGVVANAANAANATVSNYANVANLVTWANVSGKPTNAAGFGITDIYGPAFSATLTASTPLQSTGGAISIKSVLFNTISNDVTGAYNAGTGLFTAPKAGYYQINASIGATPSNWNTVNNYANEGALVLLKNSVQMQVSKFLTLSAGTINGLPIQVVDMSNITTILYLNAYDTVYCQFFYATNAPNSFWNLLSSPAGSFSACWLRP